MNPTSIRIPVSTTTQPQQVTLEQLRPLAAHGAELDDKELRFDGKVAKIKIGSAWTLRREASREAHQAAFVSLLTRAVQRVGPSDAARLVRQYSVDSKGQLFRVSGLKRLLAAVDAQVSQPATRSAPTVSRGAASGQVLPAQTPPAGRRLAAEGADSPSVADFLTPATTERKQAPPAAPAEDQDNLQLALDRPKAYGKALAGMQPDTMMGRILVTGSALQFKSRTWPQAFLAGWIEGRKVNGVLTRESAESIGRSLPADKSDELLAQVLTQVRRQDSKSVEGALSSPRS